MLSALITPVYGLCVTTSFIVLFTLFAWSESWPVLQATHLVFQNSEHALAHEHAYEKALVPQPWSFDAARDAENFGLDDEQCDVAFPRLYQEINRSVEFWKAQGGIKPKNLETNFAAYGTLRLRIIDGQLYILESKSVLNDRPGGMRPRALGTLHMIHRALILAKDVPDIEFSIRVADQLFENPPEPQYKPEGGHAVWTYTRRIGEPMHDSTWMIPDSSFWYYSGPKSGFSTFRKDVIHYDQPILSKIPKMIWRGVVWTNAEIRKPLIEVTANKDWSDVKEIVWQDGKVKDDFVSFLDHCQYAMNVHTEGRSWSGRLKYLISCHAVSFVHELKWTTHYYHLLQATGPRRNYVPVERDFSDLEAKVDMIMSNAEEAQVIADNAVALFRDRYLTPAAEACYWRRLFREYATVSFTPKSKDNGMAFEEFVTQFDDFPRPAEEPKDAEKPKATEKPKEEAKPDGEQKTSKKEKPNDIQASTHDRPADPESHNSTPHRPSLLPTDPQTHRPVHSYSDDEYVSTSEEPEQADESTVHSYFDDEQVSTSEGAKQADESTVHSYSDDGHASTSEEPEQADESPEDTPQPPSTELKRPKTAKEVSGGPHGVPAAEPNRQASRQGSRQGGPRRPRV